MDFLEKLKKDAAEAGAQQMQEDASMMRQTLQFKRIAEVAMREIHEYLKELTETLNSAGLDIRRDYPIEEYGKLKGLKQENYMVTSEPPGTLDTVKLKYVCTGNSPLILHQSNRARIKRQHDCMWGHGLRFEFKENLEAGGANNMSGDFIIEPWVPVTITFNVNEPGRNIRLTMKNLDSLGQSLHSLVPAKIDHALLEDLAKAIAGAPSNLGEKLGFKLSDTMRLRLQSKLQADATSRSKEEKKGGKEGSGLLGKLSGILKRP